MTGTHPQRSSVVTDEVAAVSEIRDGMTVAVGGFATSSHPMALVRQLIRRGVKDLTVVGGATAGLEVDMLIGARCVRKVVTAYVGGEHFAPIAPCFRAAAERGEIEIFECDEGMFYQALRAAMQNLPFLPYRSGVGTSLPDVNPELRVFTDPVDGETLIAVPAIPVDVALIYADRSDPFGNAQHADTGFGDRAMWRAAARTVVQVERVVPNEEIRANPRATSIPGADAVVRAPFGSHPFAGPGSYVEDDEHLKEYVRAAGVWARDGDRGPLETYLDKYVRGPETHLDYLESIGIRRLVSLHEF